MIYLDNAATTKPYLSAVKILVDYNTTYFFNPSGVYLLAFEVKKTLKEAKQNLAKLLHCSYTELTFTSGATEGNNAFLQGIITPNKKDEYIFNLGEHSSTYEVANYIKSKGYTVHFANLLNNGQVNIEHLLSLVNENTKLVSVMHVNNETGAINDIKKIATLVKQKNAKTLIHCDGVQAFGKLNVNVASLGVDSYIISSHKIHGPKGAGAVYVKSGLFVKPLILGGGQEDNKRSGTENVASILGFVESAKIITQNIDENAEKVKQLKQKFIENISTLDNITLNSAGNSFSPYILSVGINGIKGEILVHLLETKGVLVATGSSCSSNSKHSGNRVLEAMNCRNTEILGNIRISFSEQNTMKEIEIASYIFVETVNDLRQKIGGRR